MREFGAGLWSPAEDFVIKLARQHTDKQMPNSQSKKHCMLVCRLLKNADEYTGESTINASCLKVRNFVLLSIVKCPLAKTNSAYFVTWEGRWRFEKGNYDLDIVDGT